VTQILAFTTNMESAGDVVDKNLMTLASRRLKQGLAFSREGAGELARMMDRLIDNLRAAAALFMTSDERAARLLASEKETFRDMETEATRTHFERLRAGRLETAETGALHLDVLRDLSRINSHLVAAAAYPVLEAQGKLLPSRLRMED
jgi:phosphate:Na+ symporter